MATLSSAKRKQTNVLLELEYPRLQAAFYDHLSEKREVIREVVARHLRVSKEACLVAPRTEWISGSFNLCIPVTIRSPRDDRRVIIRFPLPYRVGEAFRPGNADEKVRCEAGAYAWLQENCPAVPIPKLYGFAFSTGCEFTSVEHLPFYTRALHQLRRCFWAWYAQATLSSYVRQDSHINRAAALGSGYLLLEYIEPSRGEMLSATWDVNRTDSRLRRNLFHSLTRILLACARVPLTRIGSFTIADDGFLRLNNRPLLMEIQSLESAHIPVDHDRTQTYSDTDSFLLDSLSIYEDRLTYQPNGVDDEDDAELQMGALTLAKATFHRLFQRGRHGPFIFTLTDLHQSNIFVDKEWNVTQLIDLEFACTLPLEYQQPPYWLTSQAVDVIHVDDYNILREDFMSILQSEEEKLAPQQPLSSIMNQSWADRTFWAVLALQSLTGFCTLVYQRVLPAFGLGYEDVTMAGHRLLMQLHCPDAASFIDRKVQDRKEYNERLVAVFDNK